MSPLKRYRRLLFLLLVFATNTCLAQLNCDDEVSSCDENVDYFANNKIEIKLANETLKNLKFENTSVSFTSIGNGGEEYKQVIVKCGCKPKNTDSDVQVMFTNPKHVYVSDGPLLGMMDLLELLDKIKFVGKTTFIYNPTILERVDNGTTISLQYKEDQFTINYAPLINDAGETTVSILGSFSVPQYDEDVKDAIPRLVVSEVSENDPLGRAEWIKVIGLLFGQGEEATAVFDNIEEDYENAKKIAAEVSTRPSVFFNYPYARLDGQFKPEFSEDVNFGWFQPSRDSYMARLVRDASADYFYQLDSSGDSLDLNFSDIRKDFASSHFLVNTGRFPLNDSWNLDGFINTPIDDLTPEGKNDSSFRKLSKELAAVRCGNVYSSQKLISENKQASDFFESAVVRPDLMLRDYVRMFHPDIELDGEFHYSYKLEGDAFKLTGEKCPYLDLKKEADEQEKKLGVRFMKAPDKTRFDIEAKVYSDKEVITDLRMVLKVDEDDVGFIFPKPAGAKDGELFGVRAILDNPADINKPKC